MSADSLVQAVRGHERFKCPAEDQTPERCVGGDEWVVSRDGDMVGEHVLKKCGPSRLFQFGPGQEALGKPGHFRGNSLTLVMVEPPHGHADAPTIDGKRTLNPGGSSSGGLG